jgi:hypothetical protein
MRDELIIPFDVRKYTPVELHRFANALTLEEGKQPQLTIESMIEKARKHNCTVTFNAGDDIMIEECGGEGQRPCLSVLEMVTALRLTPVYLNKQLYYRGQACSIVETVEDGFLVNINDTNTRYFVWRSGAEKLLSN